MKIQLDMFDRYTESIRNFKWIFAYNVPSHILSTFRIFIYFMRQSILLFNWFFFQLSYFSLLYCILFFSIRTLYFLVPYYFISSYIFYGATNELGNIARGSGSLT